MATLDTLSPVVGRVYFSTGEITTFQPGSAGGCVRHRGDLDGASLEIKSDLLFPQKQRCNKLFSGVAYKLLKMFPGWCNSPLLSALNFICSPNFAP